MAGKRVAIVTGAGSGIGKSAALALLKDGYYVGLVGRRLGLLEKTAAESGAGDRALVLATGRFGLSWAESVRALGVEVEVLDFGRASPVDFARVEAALRAAAWIRLGRAEGRMQSRSAAIGFSTRRASSSQRFVRWNCTRPSLSASRSRERLRGSSILAITSIGAPTPGA